MWPIEDLRQALHWIRTTGTGSPYYAAGGKVGVLGGSSGGQLAEALGTTGDNNDTKADAVASWAGGAHALPDYYRGCSLRAGDPNCPTRGQEAIPILNVDKTDAPMLLARGAFDDNSSLTVQEALAASLIAHSITTIDYEYPTDVHGEGLLPCAVDDTAKFFSDQLETPPGSTVAEKVQAGVDKVHVYVDHNKRCYNNRTAGPLPPIPPLV